jgi:hypothetical protein
MSSSAIMMASFSSTEDKLEEAHFLASLALGILSRVLMSDIMLRLRLETLMETEVWMSSSAIMMASFGSTLRPVQACVALQMKGFARRRLARAHAS